MQKTRLIIQIRPDLPHIYLLTVTENRNTMKMFKIKHRLQRSVTDTHMILQFAVIVNGFCTEFCNLSLCPKRGGKLCALCTKESKSYAYRKA